MYRLYDYRPSGNGYKVRLLLTQLAIPYRYTELNILQGETRTAEFLAKNPNGRIPVLELASGQYLTESNAILFYLAESTPFLPEPRLDRAEVLQWMFFEQYSHEPNIATLRFWMTHLERFNDYQKTAVPYKQEQGYGALDVMEKRLSHHDFLVANQYTIADIALFAYTHVAAEGGFDLSRYPGIQRWLTRIQKQPRFLPITETGGIRSEVSH